MGTLEDLDFSKLLQEAEALSCEIEGSTDMPRVQRNLRQVLEAGQLLVNRNISTRDEPGPSVETKASVFFGTRGVDITRMTETLEPFFNIVSSEPSAGVCASDGDLDGFLRGERTHIIYSSVEAVSKSLFNQLRETVRVELKQAWAKEKEIILSNLNSSGNLSLLNSTGLGDFPCGAEFRSLSDTRPEGSSILSKTELTYSNEVDSYIKTLVTNQPKPNLLEKFDVIARNINDKNVQELWESVSAMLNPIAQNPGQSVIEKRSSPRMRKTLILSAKQYLEKTYFAKVQSDVWKNLGGGRLGGIPTVTSILKNFVSMKNILEIPGLEVGPGDCGPVWAMAYLYLRSGHVQEAIPYMRNEAGNLDFATILSEYVKFDMNSGSLGLPKELESQVRLEYMRVMRTTSTDPFKKLVYCLLAACDVTNDHSEICNRLDDYLWLKLSQIRENPPTESKIQTDFLSYSAFQDMILEKYGETHFDAYNQPFTYFQALLLTGQFEAALEFMYRIGHLRTHAVHVAIVMYEMGLLVTGEVNSLPLSILKTDPPGIRRLNYCHVLAQYAKTFQGSNTREALNYLYLLKNIKDQSGANLFSVCVSNMAIESKNFELLFGGINTDGCRTPGMLEGMGINIRPILDHCASESENNGMLEDAVILYDLGGKAEAALTVLNRLISRHASLKPEEDSPRTRIQALALILAERYHAQEPDFSNRLIPSTFYLLVDLMTFFDEFHHRRTENALTLIERLRILPFHKDEIERCVSNFHNYSDEVRMNIPHVIIATMESLHTRYKKAKQEGRPGAIGPKGDSSQVLEQVKMKAKALVTYCGLVPYFMTGDVYSKVMQIEVQIN